MVQRLLCAFVLVLPLLDGCARHLGKPDGPAPQRAEHGFTVQRELLYTPPDWPQALHGDLYVPDGAPPAQGWPALVAIHGGAWKSGDRQRSGSIAKRAAMRGYVALAIDYRLVPGFRFPAQVQDVQQALRWLRANATQQHVDPARLALWGYSAGAHLATLTASLSPGDRLYAEDARVRAAVGGGTPSDLREVKGGRLAPFLGERWSEGSPVYAEASPIAHVSAGDPPVFLYHGSWDGVVPVTQSERYKAALDAAGIPCELYLLLGLGHSLTARFGDEAVQSGFDFLDRHLAAAP